MGEILDGLHKGEERVECLSLGPVKVKKPLDKTEMPHQKHDDFMTPKTAWENIQHLIPKDKVIWEAFYGDGSSGKYLKELGFKVIHENKDFFENNLGDVIVSNPPFSKTKEIFKRCVEIDKPFILLLPTGKLITHYTGDLFGDNAHHLQIIVPRRRIHFVKFIDGKAVKDWKDQTPFDCLYYCYKMNLPRDIVWLK